MRILIVGSGIGGMTLAALLEQRGIRVRVVERSPDLNQAGYVLGLWPLGYRVLHGLGLYERFVRQGLSVQNYQVLDGQGEEIHRWSLTPVSNVLGANISCTRPELIKLLASAVREDTLRFGIAFESLEHTEDSVRVRLSDGSNEEYDLVVGADGMHSRVRDFVTQDMKWFDTGWGGWVWWADPDCVPQDTFVEHWGAGRFLGAYPSRDRLSTFAGAPATEEFSSDAPGRRARIESCFAGMGPLADKLLGSLPDDEDDMYFWRMRDVRCEHWSKGRVVLLGDAAAGILPTAGIGASMAMESAAVLADELTRTDTSDVEHAIAFYEKRRKDRVFSVQHDSRKLAKQMFISNPLLSHLRDLVTRHYSVEGLARSISRSFNEPI